MVSDALSQMSHTSVSLSINTWKMLNTLKALIYLLRKRKYDFYFQCNSSELYSAHDDPELQTFERHI